MAGVAATNPRSDSVQDLRIPQAIFRPHDGGPELVVTPAQARQEGLQYRPGIFICPYCRERVDARVEGERRVSYFAHHEGSGWDCDRRSDGGWEYTTHSKSNWERDLNARSKSFNLSLSLVRRRADVLITGTGPVLSADDYAKIAEDARITTAGIQGLVAKAQFAWNRVNFQTKVTDPAGLSVTVASRGFSATWKPTLTDAERNLNFVVFVGGSDGPAAQAAETTDVPRTAWFVFRLDNAALTAILEQHGVRLTGAFSVSGAIGWQALPVAWDGSDGNVRQALRAMGITIGSQQRAMSCVALTGDVKSTPGSTFVISPEGRVRLLVRAEALPEVEVELVPLPYRSERVQRQLVQGVGHLLDLELDENQQFGEVYLLALDPRDNRKFLQEHRITLSRESNAPETGISTEFGVRIGIPGETFVVSPFDHGEVLLNFEQLAHNRNVVIELAVPSRDGGDADVLPDVEVRAYGTIETPATALTRQTVTDSVELNHALQLLIMDRHVTAVGISFGRLGEVRILSAEAAAIHDRPRVRVEIANALWAHYSRQKLSANARKELIEAHVPGAGRAYGWDSEINGIHKVIRRFRGRTAEAARALRDFLVAKGSSDYLDNLTTTIDREEDES